MKNNFYISFAIWLIILPLLGVPIVWKNILVLLSGVFLLLVALGPVIVRKLQTKPKKKKEFKEAEEKEELRFSDNEDNSPPAPLL